MKGLTLILFCFCDWWWLLWLLPALLGWLLGSSMSSWKSKYETAQKDLDDCRSKSRRLQGEIDDLNKNAGSADVDVDGYKSRISSLESDLAACKSQTASLESDLAASKAAASAAASASTGFAAVPTPDPAPVRTGAWAKLKDDNLQFIEGIGPKMNEVLIENGINTWAKLADMTRDGLKDMLNKYGDKYQIIEPGDWPRQAKYAVEGDWDGLIKYQSDDGSAAKVRNLFIKLGIMDDEGNYKA